MDPEPIKTFSAKYRAWFQHGGYKSFDTFEEACDASSEERGDVVRVDRWQQEILWINPNRSMD